MMLSITCPQCKERSSFPAERRGQWVSCPKCDLSLLLQDLTARLDGPPPVRERPLRPERAPGPKPAPRRERVPPAREDRDDRPEEPRRSRLEPRRERPSRAPDVYCHEACGGHTKISRDIVGMIVSDPFRPISSTYCSGCGRFVSLHSVTWDDTGETVAAFRARLRWDMNPLLILLRVVLGPLFGIVLGCIGGMLIAAERPAFGALAGCAIGFLVGYFLIGLVFQTCRDPDRAVR